MKKCKIILSIFLSLAVIIPLALLSPSLSSTTLCLSCHEMQHPFEEYKKSRHFKNPSGVRCECASCHIPQAPGQKLVRKIMAVNELSAHFKGLLTTEEKFENQRPRLAKSIWAEMKAADSRTCRTCHNQDAFVFNEFKKPREAERMKKGLRENQTCIDCHKGLVHQMPNLTSGFKKIYKELETAAKDPKIGQSAVYPLSTVVCYDKRDGEREGRILAATRLKILEKTGPWLKVHVDGWQQDQVDSLIYELQGKRIFAVALDKQAREKPVKHKTMIDSNTDQIWHQVSFDTWITTENMVESLDVLWDYGAELYGASCGCCHSLPLPAHFLANQWIGGLKDMKRYINLEKEEYLFLQKYLQLHGQDVL